MASSALREHLIAMVQDVDNDALAAIIKSVEHQLGGGVSRAESPSLGLEESRARNSSTYDDDEAMPGAKTDIAANLFGSAPSTARGTAPNTARDRATPRGPPTDFDPTAHSPAGPPVIAVEAPEGAELEESRRGDRNNRRIGISAVPVQLSAVKDFQPRVIRKSSSEMVELRKAVASSHLFAQSLEESEQEIIVNAMDVEDFAAGTDVLKQGEVSASRFYLITDGTVVVVKDGKNVATMGQGQTFGELEMMYDSAEPNAATIRTVTNCTMYWLDRDTYKNIVLKVTLEKRRMYKKMLEKVTFTESLSDYDKDTLADALSPQRYQVNDYLIRFGEKGQWMHFIVEGEVQVVGRENGKKIDIIRLGVGEPLGELEFLFNHLTVADVVALTPVKTLRVNRKHFEMCFGPITDELKRFVAKGKYEHYLKEADVTVLNQITAVEKKAAAKRVTDDGKDFTTDVDKNGEIVLVSEKDSAGDTQRLLCRYPLAPVHQANMVLVALREDGCIVSWNDTIARATNYAAAEVVGQSIYSFLLNLKDQQVLHQHIQRAREWAGDVGGFNQACEEVTDLGRDALLTFGRSDGLTKSQMQLQVVPPTVALRDAQILLMIGVENRKRPPQKELDNGQWLAEQLREEVEAAATSEQPQASPTEADQPPLSGRQVFVKGERVKQLLAKFDSLQQRGESDNLRSVNIRQLIGQVVSQFQGQCLAKGNKIEHDYEESLPDEIYVDTVVLPEVLKYGLGNSAKHCRDANIMVRARQVEDFGLDYFEVVIEDDGPGIDQKVLTMFRKAANGTVNAHFAGTAMNKVRTAVVKLGGTMHVESKRLEKTSVRFRVPFINVEDQEGESFGESEDTHGDLSSSGRSERKAKQTYTTLVVEERPVHRNMLCACLWERKHAVLPAHGWPDIHRLVNTTDIIVIDPQQSALVNDPTVPDPIAFLRDKLRRVAIIITCDSFEEQTRNAYHSAGFLTLTKPCTNVQAVAVFRKAEEKIAKIKAESDKISALRSVFAGNKTDREKKNWTKGKLLGKGAFGEVWEAIDRLTNGKMAVKILRIGPNVEKDLVKQEIETMCTLKHDNIIHYFYAEDATEGGLEAAPSMNPGASMMGGRSTRPRSASSREPNPTLDDLPDIPEEQYINVFMELAPGGTLQEKLHRSGKMSVKEIVPILRDVVEGVAYIHSQHYVHADLKTANVLFGMDEKAKIGDFGTAKKLKEGEKRFIMEGTPIYMSPECMSADPELDVGYDFKADIWSVGAMLLEMATGRPPLSHIPGLNGPMGLMSYVTELTDAPDLSCLFDADPNVFEFVRACMDVDPEKRPTATMLLDFNLFRDGDSDLKSAMKALKRAQLMHVLNAFVAFAEPVDEDTRERELALQAKAQQGGVDGGFFDSSDEDDEDSPPKPRGVPLPKAGDESDFFDSSDEDEDLQDSDPSPATIGGPLAHGVPAVGADLPPHRDATPPPIPDTNADTSQEPSASNLQGSCSLVVPGVPVMAFPMPSADGDTPDEDANPAPRGSSAPSNTTTMTEARRISAQRGDSHVELQREKSRSMIDRRSVVIAGSFVAPGSEAQEPPDTATDDEEPTMVEIPSHPGGTATSTATTTPDAPDTTNSEAAMSGMTQRAVSGMTQAMSATGIGREPSVYDEGPLKGLVPPPVAVMPSPHFRHRATCAAAVAAASGLPAMTDGAGTTTAAIVLHDAVLRLLERITARLEVQLPGSNDTLKEQYNQLRQAGVTRFEPDVASLLQRDAAMLAEAASKLS